jgi:hypothetical protein
MIYEEKKDLERGKESAAIPGGIGAQYDDSKKEWASYNFFSLRIKSTVYTRPPGAPPLPASFTSLKRNGGKKTYVKQANRV